MISRKRIHARMGRYRMGGSSNTTQNQPLGPNAQQARETAAAEMLYNINYNPLRAYAVNASPRRIYPLTEDHFAAFDVVRNMNQPTAGLQNLLQLNQPLAQMARASSQQANQTHAPVQAALNLLGGQIGYTPNQMAIGGSTPVDTSGLATTLSTLLGSGGNPTGGRG